MYEQKRCQAQGSREEDSNSVCMSQHSRGSVRQCRAVDISESHSLSILKTSKCKFVGRLISHKFYLHYHQQKHTLYLVIVTIRYGVGVDSSLLHLKEDPHRQDRLPILSTQLHQHPVADLHVHKGLFGQKYYRLKNRLCKCVRTSWIKRL